MFNPDAMKETNVIKQSDRQRITLVQSPDGKIYLKRQLSGDKREVYKILQKISHPNIPKVHYVGLDDETIVIEDYIQGTALSTLMEQNKKLAKKQIRSVLNQVLSALQKLHDAKIIHRDIKPDNILIDASNHVWLTDYDIARVYRDQVRKDTESMGTFGYAPIEQYGMLPTDFKTDIYAFGVTLKKLLDYSKIKGSLNKVAEKCKRLDPAQRYDSAKEVKRAIIFNYIKYPCLCVLVAIMALVLVMNVLNTPKDIPQNTKSSDDTTSDSNAGKEISESSTSDAPDVITQENHAAAEAEKTSADENSSFEGTFYGFSEGPIEAEYSKYQFFSNVCIFATSEPWEHVLFLDDINKKGKIKLGKNNTVVNADITLSNGSLSITLDDKKGNTYSNRFAYNNQYEYAMNYTDPLRKNADIICYDFDDDGGTELLIGLNEGAIGALGRQVYNNFNYCIAWCIKYDEKNGFTLCDGDMFSKTQAFWISNTARRLNVSWEDVADVTGYVLKDNKITPTF